MTDWNPDDPDAVRVHYDLSAWTFDQQAELAAAMADAEARGALGKLDASDNDMFL